ncbi:PGN_0703 family putative restriction endonuclease [Geodermatophilus sp. SYSU D00758]
MTRGHTERTSFKREVAPTIAAAIGIPEPSPDGRSDRFAYFGDRDRFLVVAGPQEGDAVQLALAYGLTWAGDRRLVLALPHDHCTATAQRLPWFSAGRRPELWLHDGVTARPAPVGDRAAAVAALGARPEDGDIRADFTGAATALHLGSRAGVVDLLVDWATRDPRLDSAHRQNERSWHCTGQRVLSVRGRRGGMRVLAGVHGSTEDHAPLALDLDSGTRLTDEQLAEVQAAVETGIARRLQPGEGSLHRPDEHWLQAVLRRRPHLVGIEQPALREVPAWRPRDTPGQWSRGYVDLLGLDGHGDLRVVEIKLATNDDALLVLQGLDYLTWAHAYRDVLADRLGGSPAARLVLDLVVGADATGQVALSRYSAALLAALADEVAWSVQAVTDWFGPDADPSVVSPAMRTVPAEWTEPVRTGEDAFRTACRASAVRWKERTAALPDDARRPAPYWGGPSSVPLPFCLPVEHAAANLLPDVREEALALFADLGIPWHRGHGAGPGNHLLSSQVQCVNALTRMVRDPARLQKAFGSVLGVAEVMAIEPGRHLTFAFIGSADVLGEARGGHRMRGAQNTSVDAAFLYRTSEGRTELALVEWKYTEEYRRGRPADPARDAVRRRRYHHLWAADDGPLRTDVVPFEDVLAEPFYQLMRQQLLAHELEKRGELGATAVRVVHVLPPANSGYQASLTRDSHRRAGTTVDEVWTRLLRRPDRFHHLDPAVFCDPAVTSGEYVARYGEDAAACGV